MTIFSFESFFVFLCVVFLLVFPCLEAPWSRAEHEAAMSTAGTYVAAGNVFWLNLRKLNSPSVPVSGKSLEIMINYLEGVGPHKLREEVVVVVDSFTSAAQFEKDQQQGKLRRVSPEELDHALVLHIADQIRFGADEDTLQYFN